MVGSQKECRLRRGEQGNTHQRRRSNKPPSNGLHPLSVQRKIRLKEIRHVRGRNKINTEKVEQQGL